jgi:opacity protein-like surface antigen
MSDRIDIFGGIGQLNLDEKFHIVSDDFGTAGTGRYNINTSNDMVGTQLGVHLNFPATENLGVYLLAKLGWYDNSNEQHQTVSDPVTSANRNVRVTGDSTTKTREVRVGGHYAFTSNLRMNLGYQYLKLTEVALAESQFDVQTGGTTLSNDDEITWQGLQLGLNYYF